MFGTSSQKSFITIYLYRLIVEELLTQSLQPAEHFIPVWIVDPEKSLHCLWIPESNGEEVKVSVEASWLRKLVIYSGFLGLDSPPNITWSHWACKPDSQPNISAVLAPGYLDPRYGQHTLVVQRLRRSCIAG